MGRLRSKLDDLKKSGAERRAREQGYGDTMYRGVTTETPGLEAREGMLGRGVYLTDSPSAASQFAEGRVIGRSGDAPNVMQLKTNARDIFDYDRATKADEIRILEANGIDASDVKAIPDDEYHFDHDYLFNGVFEGKDPADVLQAAGYDAATAKEAFDVGGVRTGQEYQSQVVFDPAKVRSVNAAFDPAKRESADLLAGVAGAAPTLAAGAIAAGAPQEAEAGFLGPAGKKIIADAIASGDLPRFGGEALAGAPSTPNIPGRGVVHIGRNEKALRAAEDYAERNGIPIEQVYEYVGVDPERATRIADEYARMKHNPDDPRVKKAYEAMAEQTLDQYESMLSQGVEPYFIKGADPYANSPYEALIELDQTNRLGVFPTEQGFGTDEAFDASASPLLKPSGFKIGGEPALVNDVFRAVHDYFGHAKQGAGFRAMGEENAWQAHAPMFTPEARRALTSETRGQNSWLNYGPFGESNRTAGIDDTVFADQKTGIMPNWTSEEGRVSATDRRKRFQENLLAGKTGLEGAIDEGGKVSLTHYSRHPLDRIEPEKQLTGLTGRFSREAQRIRGEGAPDRSYYGIEADINPYRKETGLGANKHKALLDGELLYDAKADPDNLWKKGDPSGGESAIEAANYSGYYFDHPEMGKVAVVFDPLNATKLNEAGFANPILLAGTAGGALAASALMPEDAEAGVLGTGARKVISHTMPSRYGEKAIDIVRNPTQSDKAEIIKAFRNEYPGAPPDTPKIRSTLDEDGNEWIWPASDAAHFQVEPLITEATGLKVDQNGYFTGAGAAMLGGALALAPEDAEAGGLAALSDSDEYVSAINSTLRDFGTRRVQKQGFWDRRRQELTDMMTGYAQDSLAPGITEPAVAMGTAIANLGAQGFAGLGELLTGGGLEAAVSAIGEEYVPQYIPETEAGQEGMETLMEALEYGDRPVKGVSGLASTVGSLLGGNSLDAALNRGADVVRQDVEETTGQFGDEILRRTGSPLAATIADVGLGSF